ncbi:hypothetical protein PybrP1_002973 [[Pythium] brassicae (nom. inval.)]|nr:hypothetical protein PybrP1_002973 [[Pythium] brassicae (nom. inval.)]
MNPPHKHLICATCAHHGATGSKKRYEPNTLSATTTKLQCPSWLLSYAVLAPRAQMRNTKHISMEPKYQMRSKPPKTEATTNLGGFRYPSSASVCL